ncbi:TetR/AcrR family transcriptional regulator [Williamsia deligens]|uniref:TetR/AcrR family transcriptional regulator n=1 Tax=Williamsia deligens TaxID=321325 RepID=A0ABW3G8L1_9NOCA|nr:TetR/AcrR family transcriptional regulator [Williamsia deligens]MCP2193873.1 transcriptional regulator, TetR family [Williamsia deligens]
MRSDAERNRTEIVDAARRMLVEDGDVTLSRVARQAGVGQGTLYRHFADRDALIRAVYAAEIDDLARLALRSAAGGDPVAGLRTWLSRLADYAVVKRGVMTAVSSSTWTEVSSETHGVLGEAVSALLGAGRAVGVVRDDVDARDVILLTWFLTQVTPDERDSRVPRIIDVIVDGLRVGPAATTL